MQIDISTCSEKFAKGIKWLVNRLKFDVIKPGIRSELEKRKSQSGESAKGESEEGKDRLFRGWKSEELNALLETGYGGFEPESMYVLSKVHSEVVDEFLSASKKESFWKEAEEWVFENPLRYWFLNELGLARDPHFESGIHLITSEQTVEGLIRCGVHEHSGPLRLLVGLADSKALISAVDYWLKSWKDISDSPSDVAIGVLALTELDGEKYSDAIKEQALYLGSTQNEDGAWEDFAKFREIEWASYAVWALSRVNGVNDPSAIKGLRYLLGKQKEDGSWGIVPSDTAFALIGLLAMGEGPKIPAELIDYKTMVLQQSLRRQKPIFLHTSPEYGNHHAKEIRDKIQEMFRNAKKVIRISSPFIDMLYDEMKDLLSTSPNLDVRIITRPRGEPTGLRSGIARDAIQQLEIASRGNVFETNLVHSRMIIIDETEVLVSSADLTMDQLVDKFNAGIWTSDKETVQKAIEYFDNLYGLKKQGS